MSAIPATQVSIPSTAISDVDNPAGIPREDRISARKIAQFIEK